MHPKNTIPDNLRTDQKLSARFWNKVSTSQPSDCWEWTAYRNPRGYGKIGISGVVHFAHRVAWELTNGTIPDGMRVLHSCDNPPCCNPGHLHLGTQADNVQEMWDRSRHGPKRIRPGHKCRGEAHHSARLTEADVRTIRALADDGIPNAEIARRYGVSTASIWAIVQRKKWKHVA